MNKKKYWKLPIIKQLPINKTEVSPRLRILHQKCRICGYLHEVRVSGYSEESFNTANSLVMRICPKCGATEENFEQWFSANPDDGFLS